MTSKPACESPLLTPADQRCRKASLHRPSHVPDDPARILHNPHFNKGSAFTSDERDQLQIRGLLPATVEGIELQVRRCYAQYQRFTDPMTKHMYLALLRERSDALHYRLVLTHLEEMLPIIYTPTVGQVCLEFGLQFRQAEGMYFTPKDKGHIRSLLDNWKPNILNEVSIIVVTDGSRILGLGDLGACGMGISLGKASLYVAAGGLHPASVLGVMLDVGTNNEKLLKDEFYMGMRHKRLPDDEYYPFVAEFMTAVQDKWPNCMVHFEDFSNPHCFDLLSTWRSKMLCYNDDIQGTGVVVAAGFLNALKISGTKPEDSKVIILGAGSAGYGVAQQICNCLVARHNVSYEQARKMFYLVDSKGLVHTHRNEGLPWFKEKFARDDYKENMSFEKLLEDVKPTAIFGLSSQPNSFSPNILKRMGEINERPLIFPLSNPTKNSECSFEEALNATDGRAIFASGSPFPPVKLNGKTFHTSQGNNLYTFPGTGFGAWLCRAKEVTDEMLTAAAEALADATSQADIDAGMLYPALAKSREVAAKIAVRVIEKAVEQGLAQDVPEHPNGLLKAVEENSYFPDYLEWKLEIVRR